MRPYFILATPRSRSTWLAAFLYRDGHPVRHDPSADYASLDELGDALRLDGFSVVDTALAVHWRWLHERFPDSPMVCLMRPYDEVIYSARRLGIEPGPILHRVYAELATCAGLIDCPVLSPGSLDQADIVADLCEHIGVPWDAQRFREFSSMHIEPVRTLVRVRQELGVYAHA